jgi:hypothetical protein
VHYGIKIFTPPRSGCNDDVLVTIVVAEYITAIRFELAKGSTARWSW